MDLLSEQQSAYVEEMGLFYERSGHQHSLGKLIGVLLILERPLTQEDLMRLLNLSRTSVSSGLRLLEHMDLVEQVSEPGDRKRHYQIRSDIGHRLLHAVFQEIEDSLQMYTKAERLAEPGARRRLAGIRELISFLKEHTDKALTEWHEQPRER
jgi:DNA-binding transcriptional regulator GbsR (MarR family)